MEDQMDPRGAKRQLRARLLAERHKLPQVYRRAADGAIRLRLKQMEAYRMARTVFCYVSVAEEVDTRQLIADMLADGKCVAVPRCSAGKSETAGDEVRRGETGDGGRRKGYMEAYEITSPDDLVPGAYGIPEPKAYCRPVRPEEIDLCVLPCLCVGTGGVRLGYGGGYYDRYLPRLRQDAVCAALCRERLLGAEPPAEPHDRPVGLTVTEGRVIAH